MTNTISNNSNQKKDQFEDFTDPKNLAINLIIEKNFWLIKSRWIYTFFIFILFVVYFYISGEEFMHIRILGLILSLSVLGNIIFISALKRGLKFPEGKYDFNLYTSMATIQFDFDLVILSLMVFFSKGFDSPLLALFIFYIMVATFLIPHNKAFKNTIFAMILVVVIYFSDEGLVFSTEKVTTMVIFNVILLFTYFISAFLSKNLKDNEKKLKELLQRSQEMSVTDGLTNLYNQAYFFMLFRLQLEKSKRNHIPFSIIIFDIDHFKTYNDNNGHMQGSEVLQRIGELMRQTFRATDSLAKYGGDEFVVILPDSDKVGTFLAADRLREMVETEPFEGKQLQPNGKVTLSMGIANFPEHGDSVEELLGKADKALYYAKESGRNKTIIYNEDIESN